MSVNIELINDDVVKLSADSTYAEVIGVLGERELLVEPLGTKQTLADFLAEGGIGYGAANEGSFAASICRIKTDMIDYGSDYQALYNVGYPLQRMAEGAGSSLSEPLGTARELTLYVRPKIGRVAVVEATETLPLEAPADALDYFVMNTACARTMGIDGASAVAVYPKDVAPEGAVGMKGLWEKRFIEDAIAPGATTVKILTQRSAAKAAFEAAAQSSCAFFALYVYTGVLVVLSGKAEEVEPIEKMLLEQPMTWKCGAKAEAPVGEHHGH